MSAKYDSQWKGLSHIFWKMILETTWCGFILGAWKLCASLGSGIICKKESESTPGGSLNGVPKNGWFINVYNGKSMKIPKKWMITGGYPHDSGNLQIQPLKKRQVLFAECGFTRRLHCLREHLFACCFWGYGWTAWCNLNVTADGSGL